MRSLLLLVVFALLPIASKAQKKAWVQNASRPYEIEQGLEGRHIALWASHGYYYDQNEACWRWQRPGLYTTCEDLFTQTIVVPFLIPMLENAGAVVFTPRERDWQPNEVIVDNDQHTSLNYIEHNYKTSWKDAPQAGFAMPSGTLHDGENPFTMGTVRMAKTTRSKNKQSTASYQPNLPEAGSYAVYVSYQTVKGSIDDAHYTVWHQGQKTEVRVNQQMGGSTWVYIGTYEFDLGSSPYNSVVLSNQSKTSNGVVTTDAVRFGGGMGNIERFGHVSGMPRCLEGARYWAQWAGMPYEVYSTRAGTNDYADDINARSLRLNELCGGSEYAPDSTGRRVPIELSLAVHSDAGYNKPDGKGIYGTLTICTTQHGNECLGNGEERQASKDLAQQLLDNTTQDLRLEYGAWALRELYDRNYSETRVPIVPSAILETLSHQSFPDMRYGLDPNFRFSLARSIYKTLLRYLAKRHGEDCQVSPLTPHNFRVEMADGKPEARISWSPTVDAAEPLATPTGYVLYVAQDGGGFDNGTFIRGTQYTMRLNPGSLYHFRVTAVNQGGQSFPSQVLSASFSSKYAPMVLVVDGFHRLASPAVVQDGFDLDEDFGVSYSTTCGVLGHQTGFDTRRLGFEGEGGLGYTPQELAGRFFAGNDFCNVRTHAEAIHQAGPYNIVSCSSEAIDRMPVYAYHLIDLVLGLERNDGYSLKSYKTFTPDLRNALAQFTAQGGNLLVSGAYVGSDMQQQDEQLFLAEVLKCQYGGTNRNTTENGVSGLGTHLTLLRQPNARHYAAQHVDVLNPLSNVSFCAMAYADGTSAASAYNGTDYKAMAVGFPLECIDDGTKRVAIIRGLLNFLLQ